MLVVEWILSTQAHELCLDELTKWMGRFILSLKNGELKFSIDRGITF